jgi:rare lipoprotein A
MMNPAAMTAAHKTLPIGTKVKVTNLKNSKSVVVRINDRGPFVRGRLIDLSKGAAQKLGFIGAGHARVQIEPADGSGTRDCA